VRRHLKVDVAVGVSFCTALDRREPAATDGAAGRADQPPVAGEAACRGGIGAGHPRLGAELGGPAAGDGVKPEVGCHLGVTGLVEGGELAAVGDCHAAAARKPPWLPNGADHELPPGLPTEDGEAGSNRPAEQRLARVKASTWAAKEPSGKPTGAHQQAKQAHLTRGDLCQHVPDPVGGRGDQGRMAFDGLEGGNEPVEEGGAHRFGVSHLRLASPRPNASAMATAYASAMSPGCCPQQRFRSATWKLSLLAQVTGSQNAESLFLGETGGH
jgi:hypothetical protein